MGREILNGEEALARGALRAGVGLVASYPGSPSSATVAAILRRAGRRGVYVEWSSNEKVALEMGIGASVAGRRALVAVKSVGMNDAVDPLMTLNLTGVHGGLVILVGDDPGGYGSQNDQDTRPLAAFLELPLVEPAGPAEAYAMIREAYDASERFRSAVLMRITRAFSRQREGVELDDDRSPVSLGVARETWRFVPVPGNAVDKHRELHRRLGALEHWADTLAWNSTRGDGPRGVAAGGFVYRKLLDVIGEAAPVKLLKLSSLFPLPRRRIERFFAEVEEVLVLEETEPFLEERLAVAAHGSRAGVRIRGKLSGDVRGREGELFRWQIREALASFLPELPLAGHYTREGEPEERPPLESHCGDCGYDAVLDALAEAARGLGQKPILIGDPGCLVTVAGRLDAKFAMGSAVAVADGISKAGTAERVVAVFGDSSFFHTTLPAIMNAVHNESDVLMVALDNGGALTTGHQPHPGVGRDAFGNAAPALAMARIVRACGVEEVRSADTRDGYAGLRQLFREALTRRVLTLLIVRIDGGGD